MLRKLIEGLYGTSTVYKIMPILLSLIILSYWEKKYTKQKLVEEFKKMYYDWVNEIKWGEKMETYKFTSVIWKEKEGYVSKCPELGVASAGHAFLACFFISSSSFS